MQLEADLHCKNRAPYCTILMNYFMKFLGSEQKTNESFTQEILQFIDNVSNNLNDLASFMYVIFIREKRESYIYNQGNIGRK